MLGMSGFSSAAACDAGGSGDEGAAMATIHDLPDSLLGAVLARLGRHRWAYESHLH